MRTIISLFLLFITASCRAQQPVENIIIITTDGLRWQEVFKGMDSAIANNQRFNQGDSAYLFEKYWSNDETGRRKKLFPFLWSTVQAHGQLYGNRAFGNKVNNANPYWFSYPGYSEIMTGYADTTVNSNDFPPNPNTNVLEFLNRQSKFKGRATAFGAWEAFDRILNEQRSGFRVTSAFDKSGGDHPTAQQQLINSMLLDSYKPWHEDE
jgi:hypothetical protein